MLAHNSVLFMIEAQVSYILQMIALVDQSHSDAIVVKDQVQEKFNQDVQHMLDNTVWQSGCVSWYQKEGEKFCLMAHLYLEILAQNQNP